MNEETAELSVRFHEKRSMQNTSAQYKEVIQAIADRCWDAGVHSVSPILMRPILFHDLKITFLEVTGAYHGTGGVSDYHRHPWYEFNYISHGSLYTRMEDTEFPVPSGHVFLIPPGVMHGHRDDRHIGDYGFCVRWELARIDLPGSADAASVADDIMAAFSHYRPRSFEFAADKLFRDTEGISLYELEAVFLRWFLEIHHLLNPGMAEIAADGKDQNDSIVRQVLLYLEEYSAQEINVHELAGFMGYSYRHLARLFKDKTGSTLIEKLNGIRIAKAIRLLENTNMPIGTIASEVGFHTETYFSTLFTQYTHLPPTLFRAKYCRGETSAEK